MKIQLRVICFLFCVLQVQGAGVRDALADARVGDVKQSEGATEEVEKALKERVEARWKALIERDFQVAYQFETPRFREVYSAKTFGGKFGDRVGWRSAEVTGIKIMGTNAQVTVRLAYSAHVPNLPQPSVESVTYVQETWIVEGGEWFHLSP